MEREFLVNLPKAYAGHKRCFICGTKFYTKNGKKKSKMLNMDAIIDVFIEFGILIKYGCRCCPEHYDETTNRLHHDSAAKIKPYYMSINLNRRQIEILLIKLLSRLKENTIFFKFKYLVNLSKILI